MTEVGRTDDITVGPCFGTDESGKARFVGKDYLVSHDETSCNNSTNFLLLVCECNFRAKKMTRGG